MIIDTTTICEADGAPFSRKLNEVISIYQNMQPAARVEVQYGPIYNGFDTTFTALVIAYRGEA